MISFVLESGETEDCTYVVHIACLVSIPVSREEISRGTTTRYLPPLQHLIFHLCLFLISKGVLRRRIEMFLDIFFILVLLVPGRVFGRGNRVNGHDALAIGNLGLCTRGKKAKNNQEETDEEKKKARKRARRKEENASCVSPHGGWRRSRYGSQ